MAGGVYYGDMVSQSRGHAERLLPMISHVMSRAGVDFDALDCVITTLGPGSFTGLRVGLSVAKTMQSTLSIPVYGLSTFDAIALTAKCEEPYTVILESKRADLYVCSYGSCTPFKSPQTATAEMIKKLCPTHHIVTGDGSINVTKCESEFFVHHPCDVADPETIMNVFISNAKPMLFSQSTAPLYLRDADVSLSKKTKRQLAKV